MGLTVPEEFKKTLPVTGTLILFIIGISVWGAITWNSQQDVNKDVSALAQTVDEFIKAEATRLHNMEARIESHIMHVDSEHIRRTNNIRDRHQEKIDRLELRYLELWEKQIRMEEREKMRDR